MKPALKKIVSVFFLIICLSFVVLTSGKAFSQSQEYKEYIVGKGDTLWGIANKEITDPFLWPKIWKENPEIKNPDLLHPGQKIRIPLYLVQKAVSPKIADKAAEAQEIKQEAKKEGPKTEKITPVEKQPIVDADALVSSGYIANSVEGKGEIIGSPTDRTLFGKGDYVYIKTGSAPKTGDKFYILRYSDKIYHPETGDFMGYLLEIMGIAEVTAERGEVIKARITASFSEVVVGDLIADYYDAEPAIETPDSGSPDVKGFIVATRQRRSINGQIDIVYIDKGRRDGLDAGDTLKIMSQNKYSIEPNGLIQVINARESTATAIVRKSEKEILYGDRVNGIASKQ